MEGDQKFGGIMLVLDRKKLSSWLRHKEHRIYNHLRQFYNNRAPSSFILDNWYRLDTYSLMMWVNYSPSSNSPPFDAYGSTNRSYSNRTLIIYQTWTHSHILLLYRFITRWTASLQWDCSSLRPGLFGLMVQSSSYP